MSDLTPDQEKIAAQCDRLRGLLLAKNKAYGSSALEPLCVFSSATAVEQIKQQLDHKLARILRGHAMADESYEDTVRDIAGYCILLLVAVEDERE